MLYVIIYCCVVTVDISYTIMFVNSLAY